jgi:hypothetical protein
MRDREVVAWVNVVVKFFLFLLIGSVCTSSMHAQVVGGTIQGTISDASGAVVPEVKVSIRNLKTDNITTVLTNSSGFYAVPNLLPGTYELSATAAGFSTALVKNVDVTVGDELGLNLTLKLGAVSQNVEITATTTKVDLESSAISNQVNSTTVRELPLNGRDWTQLATLEPGVDRIPTQFALTSGANRGNRGFGSQLTISGARPGQNNYRLDGVSINDYSNGAPGSVLGSNLGVDAVEEFSVLTSNYSAEYGRTSGGVVNAVTKSGANKLHGTAYEFLRNSALDARNYFDFIPTVDQSGNVITTFGKPPFKRNQFGASGGGAVVKNRTFIFGDYEGNRQSTSVSQPVRVPTNAWWNGVTNGPVDAKVLAFRKLYPNVDTVCAGATPDTGCTTSVLQEVINENYFTVRGDHKLTNNDNLVGTYVYDNAVQTVPDQFNDVVHGNSTKRQIVTAEDTHTFSPSLLNTVRFGVSRIVAFAGQNATAINPLSNDTSSSFSAVPGQPAPGITIGGGFTNFQGGVGGTPVYRFRWNSYQLYDDAFVTKGRHFLKFGFSTEYIQDNILAKSDASGIVHFATLEQLRQNLPTKFDAVLPGGLNERRVRQRVYAGYVQDDIHWKSNLTLNVGLRYEMSTVPTETRGQLSTLINITDPQPHTGSPFFSNPTLHNFEPRLGFAWDPFKGGRTSLRGGFGMFDVLPLPYLFETIIPLSAPFFELGTSTNLDAGSFPNCISPCASMIDKVSAPNNVRQGYVQHDPPRNYAMQWNLNVQREIVKDVTGMIAYVGSRTVHNAFRADDINTTVPLTPLNALGPVYPGVSAADGSPLGVLLNPNAGQISAMIWNGDAHYNALQTKLTARVGSRLQSQISYTWGKGIDTGSATVGGDSFANSIGSLPYFNTRLSRGPSDFNITHNLTLSYNLFLPSGKQLPTLARWAFGSWQLGGVANLSTGIPFSALIDPNTDPLGLGSSDTWDFPDRLGGSHCNSLVNPGNVNHYIKTECLTIPRAPASLSGICSQQTIPTSPASAPPPAGQITCTNRRGNLGRNSLTGPSLRNVDLSLFKNIPLPSISERFNVQFRIEAFNIFNHANFGPPLNNAAVYTQDGNNFTQLDAVSGAGQIDTTVTTSRQMQFGLKIIW